MSAPRPILDESVERLAEAYVADQHNDPFGSLTASLMGHIADLGKYATALEAQAAQAAQLRSLGGSPPATTTAVASVWSWAKKTGGAA